MARVAQGNGPGPPATARGIETSRLGRELLTRLAAKHGLDCPAAQWSPRGAGPPRHARLPAGLWAGLSHSRGRVVATLAECPLGVDIEGVNRRHQRRLAGLVNILPEAEVRDAIRAAQDPLSAFYRAWTLYEARYKLGYLEGHPPDHVLATRVASLMTPQAPDGADDLSRHGQILHAWQAQDDHFTLSLCARESGLVIETPLDGPGLPAWVGLPHTSD